MARTTPSARREKPGLGRGPGKAMANLKGKAARRGNKGLAAARMWQVKSGKAVAPAGAACPRPPGPARRVKLGPGRGVTAWQRPRVRKASEASPPQGKRNKAARRVRKGLAAAGPGRRSR